MATLICLSRDKGDLPFESFQLVNFRQTLIFTIKIFTNRSPVMIIQQIKYFFHCGVVLYS